MTVNLKKLGMPILLIFLALQLTSCSTTKKNSSSDGSETTMGQDGGDGGLNLELNADSDSNKAGGLTTIYFAFDSSALSTSTRNELAANAKFLKENSNVAVQIEGHCDERGGVQYNLALGERRSRAVRNYLRALGVSKKQMTTLSYGKERPVSFGHEENSWSQNRRANFVITAK